MKPRPIVRCLALIAVLAFTHALPAADSAPATPRPAATAEPTTFLIVLHLAPKYHDANAWTDAANAIVGAHFARLQEANTRGQVILAGRTLEPHDRTIGLVVFTATDEAAARKFMDEDPCIVAGIMSGTLHPYAVALLRKS